MNIHLYIICIMSGFICGLFASEVFYVGKVLIMKLRRVRVEIDLDRGSTYPTENEIPQNRSDNRLKLSNRSVKSHLIDGA